MDRFGAPKFGSKLARGFEEPVLQRAEETQFTRIAQL